MTSISLNPLILKLKVYQLFTYNQMYLCCHFKMCFLKIDGRCLRKQLQNLNPCPASIIAK